MATPLKRLSPGVYQNAKGKTVLSAQGITSKPPAAKKKAQGATYQGLNKRQGQIINQTNKGDLALAQGANAQLPQVDQNFSQPVDFGALPQAPNGIDYSGVPQGPQGPVDYSQLGPLPGQGNFQQYQQDAVNAMTGAFDNRFNPVFAQNREAFEQEMANSGIDPNSDRYKNAFNLKVRDFENDARGQNLAQSYGMAGSQAGQLAQVGQQSYALGAQSLGNQFDQGMGVHRQGYDDVNTEYTGGNQAYQDAYGRTIQQRYQPLADYQALRSAQSAMPTQNLGYTQTLGAQNNQADNQIRAANATYHAPSGGGGGGEAWQQMGFTSPMEYVAWQQAQKRDQQQWEWQNDPRYRQTGPSTMNQVAGGVGGILGSALQGWGASGFDKFW